MHQHFDQQVDHLVELRYPEIMGVSSEGFRSGLKPLQDLIPAEKDLAFDPVAGHLGFTIVINSARVSVAAMIPLIMLDGRAAFERLYPLEAERFCPIDAVDIPTGDAYLVFDVDRGQSTLGVTPDAALESIVSAGRSPLTIHEGIALLTQFPQFLQPGNCFSLLASRCGDKRVPALWLSKRHPRLGWCWAGNPHTWLGSASCSARSKSVEI